MRESRGRSKRLVFIPEDLLERIVDASLKERKPLAQYIEEALWEAVRAREMGMGLKEAVRLAELIQAHRASGALLVPLNVAEYMIKRVYAAERDQLRGEWYKGGIWYGRYLAEKFDDPVQAMADLLRATRWDLNEVGVKGSGGRIKFTCISTTLTEEGATLLAAFLEGSMHSLGYRTERREQMKGLVVLEFSQA
jgi:hypothetical protein